MIDLNDLKRRMEGASASLKSGLASLRTGRASVNLLDTIMVNAYNQSMPITQVSTVSALDSRMLSVQIWDKGMVAATEKAIRESDLGLNPVVDGTNLRIALPELNEERRRQLVKVAHQYTEQAKVAVRHVRKDGMDQLKKLEKDGEAGKDDCRIEAEKVQKLTDEVIGVMDDMLERKEKEIMQV